jgi:hypothetical protein
MHKRQYLLVHIFVLTFVFISGIVSCNAESRLHGCPNDALIQIENKTATNCPVCGLPLQEVKEGYVVDDRLATIWVDTLSKEEKEPTNNKGSYLKIVIYTTPAKKKSFESCKGCTRELIPLQYLCNNEKYACRTKINATCEEIGSLAKLKGPVILQPEDIQEQIIQDRLNAHKERMQQALGSWQIFHEQQQKAGFSEEQIITMFEDVKKQIYEQFKYDPIEEKFDEDKLREEMTDNPDPEKKNEGGVN